MYRKDEIQFRERYACVNIKVPYRQLSTSCATLQREREIPETLTEDWIRANVSEDRLDSIFWFVCEAEYDYFTGYAAEIMPHTTFVQDGRQGGWAVSNHSADVVSEWDAVQVAKWGKIERVAREIASGVNEQVVMSIYLNEYAPENLYVDAAPVEEAIVSA